MLEAISEIGLCIYSLLRRDNMSVLTDASKQPYIHLPKPYHILYIIQGSIHGVPQDLELVSFTDHGTSQTVICSKSLDMTIPIVSVVVPFGLNKTL